jgi:tetratricopeptide (TPR) repeat protein
MTPFDLKDEINAAPEAAKRQIANEATVSHADIRSALEAGLKDKAQASVSPKVVSLLKRAIAMMDDGPVALGKAGKLVIKALEIDDNFSLTNHAMALCLERLGRLSTALVFYERAWKQDPNDPQVYMNLGLLAWKMDMLEGAEKFLRLFLQLAPNNLDGVINFAGLLRDQGRFSDSIELLRSRIYTNPEHTGLWNSLGAALLEAGDPEQSKTFFSEALRLDEDYGRAHHNMAFAYELLGEPENSLAHFNKALEQVTSKDDRTMMEFGRALATLSSGQLKDGWDRYQARLNQNFVGSLSFVVDAPMWDGLDLEQIKGKRLLWIGEQGLGDEVLFLQMAEDLQNAVGPDGQLFIAVEHRLMGLAKSIAPKAIIGHHATAEVEGKTHRVVRDFDEGQTWDFWTPLAQPTRSLRTNLDQFCTSGFYQPQQGDIDHWRSILDNISDKPKIGIIWKSLKMDAKRTKHFAAIDVWKPIITHPDFTFINLQYGDSAEDIAYAEDKWGVKIHTLPSINLKNDLEQISALCSAMDLTLGAMNATSNLAGAAGADVWIMSPVKRAWPQLGTDRMPWYPNTKVFSAPGYGNWPQTMRNIREAMDVFVSQRKAA